MLEKITGMRNFLIESINLERELSCVKYSIMVVRKIAIHITDGMRITDPYEKVIEPQRDGALLLVPLKPMLKCYVRLSDKINSHVFVFLQFFLQIFFSLIV